MTELSPHFFLQSNFGGNMHQVLLQILFEACWGWNSYNNQYNHTVFNNNDHLASLLFYPVACMCGNRSSKNGSIVGYLSIIAKLGTGEMAAMELMMVQDLTMLAQMLLWHFLDHIWPDHWENWWLEQLHQWPRAEHCRPSDRGWGAGAGRWKQGACHTEELKAAGDSHCHL